MFGFDGFHIAEGLLLLIVAGGTFALYSLLCRHAKLSLILNQQTADAELSTYKLEQPPETPRGLWVRKLLEKYEILRHGLLIIVLLGTCMVIGDGVLTPAISGNRSPTDGFGNCCCFSLNLNTSRSTSIAGLLNVAIYWSFHVHLPSAVIRIYVKSIALECFILGLY